MIGGAPIIAGPANQAVKQNNTNASRFQNINVNSKNISKTVNPQFVIVTVEDLYRKKFNPMDLLWDTSSKNNTSKYLFNLKYSYPQGSTDKKSISFIFREDITKEILSNFLSDEQKKDKIKQKFQDLGIAHEATIFLDIPYIYEGKSEPIVERVEYLKYIPPEHLASQEIPEQVDYAEMYDMRNGLTITTKQGITEYFRRRGITNKKQQNKIIKNYEAFRGKQLT
jgi:hypothetical protein